MHIEQARPALEKATKTRVASQTTGLVIYHCLGCRVLKKKEKKLYNCFLRNFCSYASLHTVHCVQYDKDITLLSGKSLEKSVPTTMFTSYSA